MESEGYRRFLLMLSGGYGGFGWGEASNSTWDAIGLIGWRFRPRWALLAGYRAVDFDRGSSFNGFSIRLQGPIVGLSYRFGGPEPAAAKPRSR